MRAVHRHRGIENVRYRVMAVALHEDGSRIRTGRAGHNMDILKRIAHNLLRQDQSLSVDTAHKRPAATHFRWQGHDGSDEVCKGLARCTLHHKGFYLGSISLPDNLRLAVSDDLHGQNRASPCGFLNTGGSPSMP